jgi:hypothetical protein
MSPSPHERNDELLMREKLSLIGSICLVIFLFGSISLFLLNRNQSDEKRITTSTPSTISSAQLKQLQDLEKRIRKMEEKMELIETPSSESSSP